MDLRKKITEAMGKVSPEKSFDAKHPYHYYNYRDNLFCAMGDPARQAYAAGSGQELLPYIYKGVSCPAKMSSIASSSAMTYNLLGDGPATILPSSALPAGTYQVQYEKQMCTLRLGGNPANLDAFLSNEKEQTTIFCEMKLLEWLDQPGTLKPGYRTDQHYFDKDAAYPVFDGLIKKIEAENFQHYDAWQMFKHLLAIYNYTAFSAQVAVDGFRGLSSMAGKYKDITLLNVVNEFPGNRIQDPEIRAAYLDVLKIEQSEKERFLAIVNTGEIVELFREQCNVEIRIQYLSAREFAACLDMTDAKKKYLKRYFE